MARRKVATKPKPTVAFENQAAARGNILYKVELISAALGARASQLALVKSLPDDVASALRPMLPETVRQFNRWNAGDLPVALQARVGQFSRNANQTLHSQSLFESVGAAVSAVGESKKQDVAVSRADTVNGLRRRLSVSNKLREIAEKEILALKTACLAKEAEVASLRKQLLELSIRTRSKL